MYTFPHVCNVTKTRFIIYMYVCKVAFNEFHGKPKTVLRYD